MKKRTVCMTLILALLLTLLPVLPMNAEAAATTDMRQNLVTLALTQVGYKERGDNYTKYGRWYGADGQPWCAMFVSWCASMSGIPDTMIPKFAACNSGGVSWFKNNGTWKDRSYDPQPGDIVFFDDPNGTDGRDGRADHVGIVVSATETTVDCVEGNSSDSVALRTHTRDKRVLGYGAPNYTAASAKSCDMSLSGLSYPEIMFRGEAFSVYGTVKSDYAITWLYADLRNENDKHYSYGYCSPGTASANINLLASSLKFANLSAGSYYLYIEAIDAEYNLKTWKIPFTVYQSGYTIKYDANGGTPTPQAQKKLADVTINLSSTVPKRDDYIFLGWSADKNATKATYAPGAAYTANASVTLYAVWQRCAHDFQKGTCTVCGQKLVFRDVNKNGAHKPYAAAIDWAVENEITYGYEGRLFKPDLACTRAQVVTFLWRAMGSPEPETTENPFADVKNSGGTAPYYKAILWAVENGITAGFPDGTFRPHQTCTRAQFVTLMWRAVGSPEVEIENPFSDLDDNDFYHAILWAYSAAVTQGYPDGTFRPNEVCTRAQVVTFIYRQMAE